LTGKAQMYPSAESYKNLTFCAAYGTWVVSSEGRVKPSSFAREYSECRDVRLALTLTRSTQAHLPLDCLASVGAARIGSDCEAQLTRFFFEGLPN
jgi:hypothetical protein